MKLDTVKNPEAWFSRLVNYIYMEAFSRVPFSREEDKLLIRLGDLSKNRDLMVGIELALTINLSFTVCLKKCLGVEAGY